MLVDERHAIYVGSVLSLARLHGCWFEPTVDEDGNYTDRLTMRLSHGRVVTLIVPPPPDDWNLDAWLAPGEDVRLA